LADDFIAHNDVSEVIIEETSMIDKLSSMNMPNNWFCDVTKHNNSIVLKTYFTLSPFNVYKTRVVERQF